MVECSTRYPEVPGSNPGVQTQAQSEQYHYQSLCTRVKYLKLSEVKTRSHCGSVIECRTRDPGILGSNCDVAKKKISHRSNQNNTTTNPSAPELNTWNCQEVNTRSHHSTVVECRTRDPEMPGSKPWFGKKENLSQVQSEQYHHQSLCTRVKYLKLSEVKTRSHCGTVIECRTRDLEVPI